jgi:thymidylate kinase
MSRCYVQALTSPAASASDLLARLDAAVPERVLVFGSLPPAGRDLDLLARPAAYASLLRALAELGFAARGVHHVRFRDCRAEAVELIPASAWRLPDTELAAVFDEAVSLAGFRHLVEPAPHHVLLVLARRLGRRGLDARKRARIARVASADAWTEARRRAPFWGTPQELARLEALVREPSAKRLPPRPRRGHVIAFSGLDGSGKSTQVASLRAALETLGHEVVTVWTPLGSNASLRVIAAPARRVLVGLARLGFGGAAARRSTEGASLVALPDAGRGGPLQTSLAVAWSTVVAVTNALSQAVHAAPHLAVGRIVIFDRYVLDSAVQLRYLYGHERPFSLQEALLRLVSPRPLAAFFLDADPETVAARKPLQYRDEQLHLQAELYRAHYARLGVRRLDAQRPLAELCAEIAEDVWRRLA